MILYFFQLLKLALITTILSVHGQIRDGKNTNLHLSNFIDPVSIMIKR